MNPKEFKDMINAFNIDEDEAIELILQEEDEDD
jgi:hypothetical protein